MAELISSEAINNAQNILDIDNFRSNYIYTKNGETVNFVYPIIETWENYRALLIENSERKILDKKYYYRPDYLSYDSYGTVMLWQLLLYVNNVDCIENFKIQQVLIPDYSIIVDMCMDSKNMIHKDYNLNKNTKENPKLKFSPYIKKDLF